MKLLFILIFGIAIVASVEFQAKFLGVLPEKIYLIIIILILLRKDIEGK